MKLWRELRQIPNLVSSVRILIAPLLFVLAFLQLEYWFFAALAFSGLTDLLDGYLARRLNLISSLGARLDSWGDFTIYITMAACAWILWPGLTREMLFPYALILFSFVLPAWAGLVKFGKLTGYHTVSVKIAVLATYVGYFTLYTGIAQWPFVLASWLCVIAGSEEILITLLLRRAHTDVRSLLAAWRLRQRDRS
jgi:CDP-diacylglycerol--glycerol-3-phosphate 3-phosphatidyltransferase